MSNVEKVAMSQTKIETNKISDESETREVRPQEKLDWETPRMEDVSEQVMAQPYIRFT